MSHAAARCWETQITSAIAISVDVAVGYVVEVCSAQPSRLVEVIVQRKKNNLDPPKNNRVAFVRHDILHSGLKILVSYQQSEKYIYFFRINRQKKTNRKHPVSKGLNGRIAAL